MKYNLYDHRQNVLELQQLLRANHLLEGGILINPDGIFDAATTAAVKQFQLQNGMAVTGVVDFPTWKLLTETAADVCQDAPCLILL